MFDLISIGDTVIDTFIPIDDAEIIENDGTPLMAMRYGDKIPVGESVSLVAGNAANNAVGSARLGMKTAVYTNVGNKDDDEADDRIKAKFKKEKVDTRYVVDNKNLVSNHHVVLNYKGERTILIFHQPWKFDLPELEKSRWIYLTSMAPSYVESPVIDQLINYLERTGSKLAYQPGTFQIKQGLRKSAKLLSMTEIFFVNLEEAKLLLGYDTSENIPVKKLLQGLADHGPRQVVVTDGGEGSYGFDGNKFYKLGVFKAELNEMTGAGDAFATGTVAGLFYGESLDKAMRWGAANGSAVVEQIGPQAGLLTTSQMQDRLKANSKVTAKEI